MTRRIYRPHGVTLVELMLVVVIIAILAVAAFIAFQHQSEHAYDTQKKSDLTKLRTAFEDYYNDHICYPKKSDWDNYNCITGEGGDFLKPYVQKIPCDPQTKERYLYITEPIGIDAGCGGYHLLAVLTVRTDPDIKASGCDPDPNKGCGFDPHKYNYGVSMGVTVANADFDFTAPTPTPTPEFPIGNWICPPKIGNQTAQNCQYYSTDCRDKMILRGCITYDDAHKYTCSDLCNPSQKNVCNFLYECN